MLPRLMTTDYSPAPILCAIESYRGNIIDLDSECVVGGEALARMTGDFAARMRKQGLSAGDRVVMAVGNGPQFVVVWGAILASNGSPLLLHVQTPPGELHRTALEFGARFIATDGYRREELAAAAPGANVISWDLGRPVAWAELNEAAPGFVGSYPRLAGMPLHPTSGTTGRPKVAVRPARCAMAEAQHYIETIGIDQADTILAAVPMSHAYGYGMCLMVPLIANAAVATMRRFDPTLARQALRDYGVSVLPVAPVMLDLLLLGGHDEWCPGPQRVFSAGAPLPERTARAYHSRCGTVVRPLYGTTETGGISVVPPGYEVCHATSVGKPMRGVEVELVRVNGEFPETVGRLHVRSSSMMAGYLGRDELEPADLADGWFETGDLARIDASGAIHLTGRETDVINVFGMKVVPSEVEAVISRAPGVVEVKVYAGAHHSGSQIVKAAVVADGRFDTSIIRAYCERQLAAWKRPEIIVRVDSLPRSHNGKVIREQLP